MTEQRLLEESLLRHALDSRAACLALVQAATAKAWTWTSSVEYPKVPRSANQGAQLQPALFVSPRRATDADGHADGRADGHADDGATGCSCTGRIALRDSCLDSTSRCSPCNQHGRRPQGLLH